MGFIPHALHATTAWGPAAPRHVSAIRLGHNPGGGAGRLSQIAGSPQSALGKRKGARALFLGTRPASDSHFFARLLAEPDESIYAQVHAASTDSPPFQVATWRRANPGLAFGLPALDVLRAEARLAKRDAAELATFRALRLNQGTSEIETQHLIAAETWREVERETLPAAEGPWRLGSGPGGHRGVLSGCCLLA